MSRPSISGHKSTEKSEISERPKNRLLGETRPSIELYTSRRRARRADQN